MSKKALQEIWPSFLRDDKSDRNDRDGNAAGSYDEERNENSKGKDRISEAEEEIISSRKNRKKISYDERFLGNIDQLLDSYSEKQFLALQETKDFLPQLERYSREHPETFFERPGVVPLLLAALTQGEAYVSSLELSRFKALSGNQVVELVETVVARNTKMSGEKRALESLDISFNGSVTPEDIAPKVVDGRIAKVTTRAGFLAPLEKWAKQTYDADPVRIWPPPPTTPTKMRVRQVVWMTLLTQKIDFTKPATEVDSQFRIPLGALSLEDFDTERLALNLHPDYHFKAYARTDHNRVFAELVAFPHYDAWTPLAEIYTSLARIEKFMSHKSIVDKMQGLLLDRWPLIFPLMMAMGDAKSEWAVTSPFPAEPFHLAMWEARSYRKLSRIRGPDPIMHSEHTLVLLREPDLGRLRERGIGALPLWKDKKEEQERNRRYQRNTMLLDTTAVDTMWAAAAVLASNEKEIAQKINNLK
ncbi:hypothetical protein H072_8544 [Dactylellina haptotyla CBS 200.50]|uniref:Uncharacterized protein n=1 Tax=Dactylellina haptotyla (strain CBS 200.50) TaxID=1284197 RepID=S8A4J9_DACHA|nr:hypothetical protein H072_8544 [Dactylellina haptotyla CBS 200.50]